MFKRKARRTAAAVRIAIAIAPLAACDGSIETAAAKQADSFSSVSSDGPMQNLPVADFAVTAQVAAIEHHHFDVYTSYHAVFDGTPMLRLDEGIGASTKEQKKPGISFNGSSLPDTIRTCSVRTLLLLE